MFMYACESELDLWIQIIMEQLDLFHFPIMWIVLSLIVSWSMDMGLAIVIHKAAAYIVFFFVENIFSSRLASYSCL